MSCHWLIIFDLQVFLKVAEEANAEEEGTVRYFAYACVVRLCPHLAQSKAFCVIFKLIPLYFVTCFVFLLKYPDMLAAEMPKRRPSFRTQLSRSSRISDSFTDRDQLLANTSEELDGGKRQGP